MKTTATNRKLRVILSAVEQETLIPNPDFQRRLVWSMKDKNAFLRTVLGEYPFPEIYVAAGSVNPDTAEGIEMLVDGQQRVTTLHQYFKGSAELKLATDIPAYAQLKEDEVRRKAFLEYEVVVRDLGQVSNDQIIEVFKRINSTSYSLNSVEIQNASYAGAFKEFAEEISESEFFDRHHVFTAARIRRMDDLRFALTLVTTLLSTYFNRNEELEQFLERYNDEFGHAHELRARLEQAFAAVDAVGFDDDSPAWNEATLLPLLVEIDRALRAHQGELPNGAPERLRDFLADVSEIGERAPTNSQLGSYYEAQRLSTADRSRRLRRGDILRRVIEGMAREEWSKAEEATDEPH